MIPGNTISIAHPFSSMAVLLLFAGGGHAASSRLALNENGHTLNAAFPGITGIAKQNSRRRKISLRKTHA